MKIFVVSDSHGMNYGIEKVIDEYGPFDKMIHLGDSEVSQMSLQEAAQCEIEAVVGNSDRGLSYPETKVLEIGKHRIFITHGHRSLVDVDIEYLIRDCKNANADTAMFGHIHKPLV